jgi:mannose-6-phosphate isomerase-like protein (cupin superfamily)
MNVTDRPRAIDLTALSRTFQERHTNVVVDEVNESCLRIAVITGNYRWHRHPSSDEMFMVLEGELFIDFQEAETVSIKPLEVFTVPAGVIHRTRSVVRTVNLCFEHLTAETEFIESLEEAPPNQP